MPKTKKTKLYLVLIAILAAACLVVVLIGLLRGEKKAEVSAPRSDDAIIREVEKRVEVEKLVEVEKEISAEILQDGLNDMGVLVTEEYYFTEVVGFNSIKKFLNTDIELKFTESSYLVSYDGVVTAGFDFGAVTAEKDDAAKTIRIRIPAAEILGVDIDPESFQLHSEKTGFGNAPSVADFNASLIELESTAREKAAERGLLTRADENAKKVIETFVGSLVDLGQYRLTIITG